MKRVVTFRIRLRKLDGFGNPSYDIGAICFAATPKRLQ